MRRLVMADWGQGIPVLCFLQAQPVFVCSWSAPEYLHLAQLATFAPADAIAHVSSRQRPHLQWREMQKSFDNAAAGMD